MSIFRACLVMVFIGITQSAYSADVTVKGRSYTHSCGYFTHVAGDYVVRIKDESLPWGTRVNLVYGLGGADWSGPRSAFPFTWAHRTVSEMKASEPFTWSYFVSTTIQTRGSHLYNEELDFVFEIIEPDAAPRYENGGSAWGYYRVKTRVGQSPCISNEGEEPARQNLDVQIVKKD